MKKLTTEQKAKRYEVFEKALLAYLNEKADDAQYDDEDTLRSDVVADWLDQVDDSSLFPHDIYLLLDKIIDENFAGYFPMRMCTLESVKKECAEFEQRIGG